MKTQRGSLARDTYVAVCGDCGCEHITAEVKRANALRELRNAGWDTRALVCRGCRAKESK